MQFVAPTDAAADQFHAEARDRFDYLVGCQPPVDNPAVHVHAAAAGIRHAINEYDNGTSDQIDMLIATLAYAVVTEKVRRQQLPIDLSHYTAAECGAFDG